MASVVSMIMLVTSIISMVGLVSATTNHLPFLNDDDSSNSDNNLHRSVHDMIEFSLSGKHEQWMAQFGREYKNAGEKEVRFKIFRNNAEYIESVNRAGRSYKLGLNKFADLTNEEFKDLTTCYSPEQLKKLNSYGSNHNITNTYSFKYENLKVPESLDWKAAGAVTPVKDQSPCGCCWIFGAVAAIEGMNQIKTDTLTSLSEQQILDCITFVDGRDKCSGGSDPSLAFSYVEKSDGLTTDADYPYTGEPGDCGSDEFSDKVKITNHLNLLPNNEALLEKAVVYLPVVVSIDGTSRDFQLYGSGVFDGSCGTNPTHVVAIIGYGTEEEKKYWLVKNSWGTNWGEGGFAKILKFDGTPEGWHYSTFSSKKKHLKVSVELPSTRHSLLDERKPSTS